LAIRAIALSLYLCGVIAIARAQATFPGPPGDVGRAKLATGQIEYLYAVKNNSQFFFRLQRMPAGIDWFQILVDENSGTHSISTAIRAAQKNWEVGIYHQPDGTVDAIYAHVPAGEAKR
jgi:hypothetical protein